MRLCTRDPGHLNNAFHHPLVEPHAYLCHLVRHSRHRLSLSLSLTSPPHFCSWRSFVRDSDLQVTRSCRDRRERRSHSSRRALGPTSRKLHSRTSRLHAAACVGHVSSFRDIANAASQLEASPWHQEHQHQGRARNAAAQSQSRSPAADVATFRNESPEYTLVHVLHAAVAPRQHPAADTDGSRARCRGRHDVLLAGSIATALVRKQAEIYGRPRRGRGECAEEAAIIARAQGGAAGHCATVALRKQHAGSRAGVGSGSGAGRSLGRGSRRTSGKRVRRRARARDRGSSASDRTRARHIPTVHARH